MSRNTKLVGLAGALGIAIGAFGLVNSGASAPAAATPAASVVQDAASVAQPAADCSKQAWPYLAPECLAAAQGTPVRKVSRTIMAGGR